MSLKNENLQILFFDYIKQAEKKIVKNVMIFLKYFLIQTIYFLLNLKI